MKKILLVSSILLLLCLLLAPLAYSWGFFGHKKINKMAVFTLPPELIGFYKKHIGFITDHSVDPDRRRYANENEAPRHYIDIDHYGISPFDSMPQKWNKAVEKYTEDTLKAYGILPWNFEWVLNNLTKAFKEQNINRILQLSADLGHYIGDAHVPLHTSENHDGQLTNQKGIHAFWESRIPELRAGSYDFLVGRAEYIDKPRDVIWKIIRDSHAALDSVLKFEAKLNELFDADRKYSIEIKGKQTIKNYSEEYTLAYDKMIDGMVERRMRSAIYMVGCFWYTAWVNAGQPDLKSQEDKIVTTIAYKEEDSTKVKSVNKPIRVEE